MVPGQSHVLKGSACSGGAQSLVRYFQFFRFRPLRSVRARRGEE